MRVKVNANDYLEFRGISLELELMNSPSDNRGKQADIYISGITDFIYDYMESNFKGQRYEPNREEVIKKAILYQMEYFLEHGDLSVYNPDNLNILAPNAYRVLKNAGLANSIGGR